MRKGKKKTFVLTVIVKGRKVPDFGMGKGVLGFQEIEFTDERGYGFNSALFAAARMEHEQRLSGEMLHFTWKEKKKK